MVLSAGERARKKAAAGKKAPALKLSEDVNRQLKEIFVAFCSFGKGDAKKTMDGKTFTKVLKDSKIIGKQLGVTTTDADLVFTKIKVQGKRLIGYVTFKKGIKEIATRKRVDATDLVELVIASGGPKASGTRAANVRLVRKDQFVGVHQRGGPSTVDLNPSATGLAGLLDRSENDVRGRKVKNGAQKHKTTRKFKKSPQKESL